jgi:hypothetical protein
MLKRRLHEPPTEDGEWTNAELNTLLNEGYKITLLAALEGNPEEAVYEATANLVADQNTYTWPTDLINEIEVNIYDGSKYVPLAPASYEFCRTLTTSGTPTHYARYGRFVYLAPAPSASLVDGLKLVYVPFLGLSEETSIPQLRAQWHPLIVLNAQILALGETADQSASVIAERNALYMQLLGAGRRTTAARPTAMSVGITKTYGRARGR